MSEWIRKIKNASLINAPGRMILRLLSYDIPAKLNASITPKWRVNGKFTFQVGDTKLNFYSEGDDGVADALYYQPGHYEEYHELELFCRLSKNVKTVLDIGANTGIFSVTAALSNKNCFVYAFEPYYINANRLKKNLALNNISNAEIIPFAVGDTIGEITFTIPENESICDVLSANGDFTRKFYRKQLTYKNTTVNQTTVDAFVKERKITKTDLIKIDVESYEIAVWKGMSNTLKEHSPVVFCEIFFEEKRDLFYESFLNEHGYYIYMVIPDGLIRINQLYNNPDGRNYIFSRKKSVNEYLSFKDMNSIVKELF